MVFAEDEMEAISKLAVLEALVQKPAWEVLHLRTRDRIKALIASEASTSSTSSTALLSSN